MDFGLFILSFACFVLLACLTPFAIISVFRIRAVWAKIILASYAVAWAGSLVVWTWTRQVHFLNEPLWEAARAGNINEARRLLKEGADPNDSFESTTALEEAEARKDKEMIELLKRAGARW
ncbi:MAG: hypothetical protein JSS66_17720 [Armatimonadetes bacterium]|nr:hypothetical protein [Armatimonadota bacterium]